MSRIREAAGGGRAVEVAPERLAGWFDRFGARHGGIAATGVTSPAVLVRADDGATATVAVPFGGLPAAAAGEFDGLELGALHAHLALPRRTGLVLVRLGGYSVGVAVGGVVELSSTGARQVHGRNKKGGSSSGRFARRREGQVRVALNAAADVVARVLLPVAGSLDALVLGGDATALDELRADRRLTAFLARAEPRILDVPEPRRAVLDAAAQRSRSVEVVVSDAGWTDAGGAVSPANPSPASRRRRARSPR